MRIVACLAFCSLIAIPAVASHDPLAGLTDVLEDEVLAVDTARAIDLEQRALATWQEESAKMLAASGKIDEANSTLKQVRARYRAIQEVYEHVLARYPDNARANNYYGDALIDFAGEETKAVSHWTKSTEIDPNFAPPWISLGNHYTHNGQYETGLRAFDNAIAADPDSPEGYFHLVQVYLINWPDLEKLLKKSSAELYADALAMSEKASKLAPDDLELARDYALNFFAGERMQASVDWEKAANAWEHVYAIATTEDTRFQAQLYKARAHIHGKEYDAAEASLQRAIEIHPSSGVAKDLLREIRALKTDVVP